MFLVVTSSLVYLNIKLQGGGGEFYVHWAGSRAFIFDKIEPYSGDVAARTQTLVYGRSARAGEEPYILDTPFYILPLYFLLSLHPDPLLARALFTSILELGVCLLAYLSLRLTDAGASRYFSAFVVLFGIANYYSVQAIYAGSPVILLGLLYAGILLSLRVEMDQLTGALLALSFYYWEVGTPFLFLVILRAYHEKRVGVLAGFLMVATVLLAVSFLLYPGWIVPFMRAVINNMRIDFGFNIFTVFSHFWPSGGRSFAWMLIVGLLILLGIEWNAAHRSDFRRFYWVCCLTLAAAPLLGLRTEMEHLAVLILPLALIFAVAYDRWHRFVGFAALFLVFAAPWTAHFMVAEQFGETTQNMLYLFLPISTIVGLYWIRWWAIKPPRTWRDLASRSSSSR